MDPYTSYWGLPPPPLGKSSSYAQYVFTTPAWSVFASVQMTVGTTSATRRYSFPSVPMNQ